MAPPFSERRQRTQSQVLLFLKSKAWLEACGCVRRDEIMPRLRVDAQNARAGYVKSSVSNEYNHGVECLYVATGLGCQCVLGKFPGPEQPAQH